MSSSKFQASIFSVLIVLFALVLFAAPARAQRETSLPGTTLEIIGQVRIENDGSQRGVPIENVLVRLERFGSGLVNQTALDSTGRFRFAGLTPGQYLVYASASGFLSSREQVELDARMMRRAQVFLSLVPDTSLSARNAAGAPALFDARVPANAQREYAKGRAELAERRAQRAIQHFARAIEIYPDYYEAHFALGTTHMNLAQWAEAESSLLRALNINPRAVVAQTSLGEVYRRQERYQDAERILSEALRVDNDSWQGHFTLGRVYFAQGNLQKAGQHIARTIELKPNFADARLIAGNIFLQAGLRPNAIVEYEEYLRLAPTGEFAPRIRQLVQQLRTAPNP